MAHSIRKKAMAMAMLMTGSGVRETARATGVPVATVGRWKKEDVLPRMREFGRANPELAELGRRLRALKTEHKKGK